MTTLCFPACGSPATQGSLCTVHAAQLRGDLRDAPGLLDELDVTLTGQGRQGGNSGSGERWAFNPTASDRAEDVMVVLRSAAHTADPRPVHRYEETALQLVERCLANIDNLLRHPHAQVIAQDLHDYLDLARAAMDRAPERRVVGICDCGNQLTTTRTEGSVYCRACERKYDIQEWEAYRKEKVLDTVGTPTQICAYFNAAFRVQLTDNEIRRWKRRKLLHAVEETPTRRTYRVGDVMNAWESWYKKDLPGRRETQDAGPER